MSIGDSWHSCINDPKMNAMRKSVSSERTNFQKVKIISIIKGSLFLCIPVEFIPIYNLNICLYRSMLILKIFTKKVSRYLFLCWIIKWPKKRTTILLKKIGTVFGGMSGGDLWWYGQDSEVYISQQSMSYTELVKRSSNLWSKLTSDLQVYFYIVLS